MEGRKLYSIYASKESKWSKWVRPVPFVAIDKYNIKPQKNWTERKAIFLEEYIEDVAIFVDLPGTESIEVGIDLAKKGYKPVPVFNGTNEQSGAQATTDTYLVESSLISGAERLKNIKILQNANPAFLLDTSRLNRFRANESIFDNSWDLYGQDIPSFEYFKENGIKKIIVVGNKINRDLRKIFFKFQDSGMEFYWTDGYLPIKKVILKKTLKEKLEKEEL